MKSTAAVLACVTVLVTVATVPARGQAARADALLPPNPMARLFDEAATDNSPAMRQYTEGKQAIRDGRWADAVTIFTEFAKQGGSRSDSALYWKAYALNKAGRSDEAIRTCEDLRSQFRKSSWNDDCGALQIEINSSRGKPQTPQAEQSDELKLLALASLLQKDPTLATQQIKELVQGDASERLKEGAVFILGQQVPDSTYPQIVRISYLEGEVRVARASENEKSSKPQWDDAVMNLPIQEGDSLTTGKDGRAEIEFEDASTIYLGENSVLNFEDLHTTAGVPHSEVALVSGTVTTHLDSLMGGETFLLRTPTENLLAHYPEKSDLRITSYLDGMAVTPLAGGVLNVTGGNRVDLASGKTLFFKDGHHLTTADLAGKTEDFSAYDAWVADRFAARSATTEAMMKEAGLTKPIPGLAEMKGKGHFFSCPPYGTCWQPDEPQANAVLAAPPAPPPTPKTAGARKPNPQQATAWFPCADGWYMGSWGYGSGSPYYWGVCHSGDWVPYNNSYAWVATGRRHHHCPVRWVQFGKHLAMVPLSPRDSKGKPLVNREQGFIPLKSKDGLKLLPVKFEGKPLEPVKSVPKEFRNAPQPLLVRAEPPRMLARAIHENAKAGIPASRSLAINFNPKQGFTTPRQIMQSGRTTTVNFPVGRPGSGVWASGVARGGTAGFGALGGAHAGGGFGAARSASGFTNGSVSSNGFNSGASSFSGGGGGTSGGTYSAPAASGGPVSSPSPAPR